MPRNLAPRRAILAALIVAMSFVCLFRGTAQAGTYDITSCNSDGSSAGWSSYSSGSWVQSGIACPTNGDLASRGFGVANLPNVGIVGNSGGGLQFKPPAGTSIVGIGAGVRIQRWDDGYWMGLITASGLNLYGAWANDGQAGYTGAYTASGWWNLNHESGVHLEVGCSGLCDTAAIGPSPSFRVWAQMYDPITIRIEDTGAPSETISGGSLLGGTYATGTGTVTYSASDASGIRATRLYVDGTKLRDDTRSCSFNNPAPCSNVSNASYALDTRTLADGPHTVKVETVDSAGNATSQSRSIQVDNTAPAVPSVSLSGGEGWRSSNKFDVSWTNPTGQASPIVKAHYSLCRADQPTDCQPPATGSGMGINSLSGLSVPDDGDYALQVWLEDAAGNAEMTNASAPVHLRFDNREPGQASPQVPSGWLDAGAVADGYDITVRVPDSDPEPPSGIAGYAVTTDGSDPATSANTGQDGSFHAPELREGITTIKARAISGSGVASTRVGSAELHVDTTPPEVEAAGAPDPDVWQSGEVKLRIRGADQEALSGMASGHVSYAVDGGPTQDVAGDTADVVIAGDGQHTVAYSATDAAGNRSPVRQVSFGIDSTPPGAVQLDDPGRWLNASDQEDYRQPIRLRDGARPVSGLAGYSFTTDGTDPDATPETDGEVLDLGRLDEGDTTIRARAVSRSGLAGDIGALTLHLDRTPPDVVLSGAPDSDRWADEPAHLRLAATDALSGMAGTGAHLTYVVDGEEPVTVDGDLARVDIDAVGEHTLRYYAIDAAGNRSATKTASFKIDVDKPGAAEPASSEGWITVAGPFQERIGMGDGEVVGSSGLSGFSVTTDGSTPDATPEIGADGRLTLQALPDGVTTVKARAISGAGLPSDAVGVGTIKVDRTPPLVRLRRPDGQLPARLEADATDATSGVESGRIEIRRADTAAWKPLDTALEQGKLVAAIDPVALAGATYSIRAVVADVAGNASSATTFADGAPAKITITVPAQEGTPAQAAPAPAAKRKSGSPKHGLCPGRSSRRGQARPRRRQARNHRGKRRTHHIVAICGHRPRQGGEKHRRQHLGGKTHKPARGIAG